MNGQYRKNTIIPAFLALFQKLWGTNLFVLLCAYTILLWIMMHPFSPFCSPNFAHHFPAHPVENTVLHSLFICQCPGARLLRPSHTSGTKDPCCPFCAFPAFVLLKTRTCCLWSVSPLIRSRTPSYTLFFTLFNVPASVSSSVPYVR